MKYKYLADLVKKCTRISIVQVILAISFFCTLFAENGRGQASLEKLVTIQSDKIEISAMLNIIKNQTGAKLVYSSKAIRANRKIEINVSNLSIKSLLQDILNPLGIGYSVMDDKILLHYIVNSQNQPTDLQTVNNQNFVPQKAERLTGTVVDANGVPLQGASVSLKNNSKIGTVTDKSGKFSFEIANFPVTIVISYVGFANQEVNVSSDAPVQVQLMVSDSKMNEVVVVGYGTQLSKNITGAVSRVGSKEITEVPVVGLDQALIGRVAGVMVTENSAEPGGEVQIRIRGIASITSGSNPLVVIDGVPMSVNLNAINPNDIQSIDLLKDAASTAIYGSRASAGVVLVTTKRGKAGKSTVSFDGFSGIQNVGRTIPLLNGPEFAKLANENLVNGGIAPNPAWANPNNVISTDWQDALFRSAMMHSYNVSLSGGSEKVRSFISFGYLKKEGIIERSVYDRLTSRVNLDFDISSRVKAGVTATFTWDKNLNTRTQEEFWGVLNNAMRSQPTSPVFTDNVGAFGDHLSGVRGYALRRANINNDWYALQNPVFINDYYSSNGNQSTQLLSNAFLEIEIIKGLKAKSILGYNIDNGFGTYGNPWQLPQDVDPTSRASYSESWSRGNQWNLVNTLNYNKTVGNHAFGLLAGTDALKGTGRFLGSDVQFAPEDQQSISAGSVASRNTRGNAYIPFSLFSYLSRFTYGYDNKYLLTLNYRRDGSSKFAEDNRYGDFLSGSMGWRISQENFMKNVRAIDDLKLRVSYGSVGNQNIPDLQYLSQYGNDGGFFGYSLGINPTLVPGLRPTVIGNPGIRWERNTEFNIGLDGSLLGGKITFTADWYRKNLIDLLGTVPITNYAAPFNGQVFANAFTMVNSGIELTVGFNQKVGDVNLTFSGNFSTINNEVTGLIPGNSNSFLNQSISMIGSNVFNDGGAQTRTMVGERIGNFWGYVFDGIIQNPAELAASGMIPFGAKVGDKRFKDLNGDKIINDNDKTSIGNGLPGFIYGFNIGAQYKGFDLTTFFNGQGDVQIANMTNAILNHMRFHNSTGIVNGSRELLNSWTGPGTSNTLPRNSYDAPTSNRFFSTDYIENGAFLRLRNVQLGYNFPSKIASKLSASSLRVYVSAQNLFTITEYSGYDPEVGSAQIGTRVQTAGVDFGRFPRARMLSAGFNVQF